MDVPNEKKNNSLFFKFALVMMQFLGVVSLGVGLVLSLVNLLARDEFGVHYSPITWNIILALIVGGLIFWAGGLGLMVDQFRTIIGTADVADHDYSSGLFGTHYYLVLSGVNRAGQTITQRVTVGPRDYWGYEPGDKYEVKY